MKRLTFFIGIVFISMLVAPQGVSAGNNPALIIFEGIDIGMNVEDVESAIESFNIGRPMFKKYLVLRKGRLEFSESTWRRYWHWNDPNFISGKILGPRATLEIRYALKKIVYVRYTYEFLALERDLIKE